MAETIKNSPFGELTKSETKLSGSNKLSWFWWNMKCVLNVHLYSMNIEHVLKISELLDNQMSEIKFVTLWWFAAALPSRQQPHQLIQNKCKNFNSATFNALTKTTRENKPKNVAWAN